jgi:endonuclease/exonuclease/phosphatase (EEP) superfamily protein YafD
MIVRLLLWAALAGGTAATLAGLLAPFYPPADFINHFRPFILGAACGLFVAALGAGAPQMIWLAAALSGLNAVLLLAPLVWSAQPAQRPTAGQALASARERELKIVTFNTFAGDPHAIADFLLREDGDVAVLQEVGAKQAQALGHLLRNRYPHAYTCAPGSCAAAIFAKRPWASAGQQRWTQGAPETIWIEFNDPEIGRLRVVGVHLHLPYRAEVQTRQIDWLITAQAAFTGPTIVAGDFNMTPWSYRLQRLLASTGLRRHATFLRSWPTVLHPQFRLPAPAFLIDHVLTTPDIKSVSIRTGPVVGSDHLPVIAQVRLPGL